MTYFALSGLINGLSATFLGIFVLSRNPRDLRNRIYAVFCFCLSAWSYAYFQWLLAEDETAAFLWARLLIAGAIFIPITAFHHLVRLLGKHVPKSFIVGNYVLAFLLSLANLSHLLVDGVSRKFIFPFWPNPGPLFPLHLVQFVTLALLGLWFLGKEMQTSEGIRLNQIKFLLLAELVGWGGGSTNYPLWYDVPVFPYGNILVTVYTGIVAYAMVRYRLLDIEIVVKKSLMYALLLLGLLAPCYLVLLWAQKFAYGKVDYSFSLISLFLFVAIGFLFPKFRFKTEEALERVLFKKHYDYRETLLRFSRDLVSIVDLQTLSDNLLRTVGKALEIERASLFLFDEVKGALNLKASIGLDADQLHQPVLLRDEPLVQKLMVKPEAVVREEVEMARDGPEQKLVAEKMSQLGAEVSLPLVSKERLIGMLNMGHKQGRGMYSDEDLEVLTTLANQAAIAIENARLYENLKRSQDIIRRADRLSSLGMLTAGLAHEIRNPLVAIRTFTQLLPERYADVEFRNNFQTIALKEVDRICGLVNDLLSFARPTTPNVSAEDVNQIVDSTARMLETQAKENDTKIQLNLERGIPNILIDKEQIKQVLVNLVLNAIQAIEDRGVVELSTRSFVKEGSQQFVQIGVRDSGVGIAVRDLENIFNPFFTTKEGGSGLGLSISHQIVQDHGGSIVVESKVEEGSTFLINLPVSRPLKY